MNEKSLLAVSIPVVEVKFPVVRVNGAESSVIEKSPLPPVKVLPAAFWTYPEVRRLTVKLPLCVMVPVYELMILIPSTSIFVSILTGQLLVDP